ncbi:HDOD domain-containing protein, partial [Rubrivirga litoralis]
LLGPVTVVGLAAGMGMARLSPLVTARARAVADRIIRHSLASAYLARALVGSDPTRAALAGGGAYTAGLLHDLGKLVLLHSFPDEAAALYGDRALDAVVAADDGREHER